MLTIGSYTINGKAVLAPMAGVSDLPFRQICQSMGAALATSEMLSSNLRLWHSEKSRLRLAKNPDTQTPNSIQIAGSEPQQMAEAAQAAERAGADIIDINMGCPAKKVCKKLAGSALLKDEALVSRILAAVVASVRTPVTLKIRTGWDTQHKNGGTIARIAEAEGVSALTVHGRTRACRFHGHAEYDSIAAIVAQVAIPVIANGDIDSADKAAFVLNHTGASAVMIGRAALGNPWIFHQVSDYLHYGRLPAAPEITAITEVMTAHLQALYHFYGEHKGLRIARKHFAWYCQQHLGQPADIIQHFNQLDTPHFQLAAISKLVDRPHIYEENAA